MITIAETITSARADADANYELYRRTLKALRAATAELNALKQSIGLKADTPLPDRQFH